MTDMIPAMASHLFYSIIQNDPDEAAKLAYALSEKNPDEIAHFLLILSALGWFKLLAAASTESAIISTAVSFENGLGPW